MTPLYSVSAITRGNKIGIEPLYIQLKVFPHMILNKAGLNIIKNFTLKELFYFYISSLNGNISYSNKNISSSNNNISSQKVMKIPTTIITMSDDRFLK